MTEVEYRKHPAKSQSEINAFAKGLKAYRTFLKIDMTEQEIADSQDRAGFRKGSAVDHLVLQSVLNYDSFNTKFVVVPDFNFDTQAGELIKSWLALDKEWDLEALEDHSVQLGLFKSTKDKAKRIANFSELEGLYNTLRNSKGKTRLTESEFETVNAVTLSLRNDPRLAYLFDGTAEILFQLPIIGELNGHAVKGLLDWVTIDREAKTIGGRDLKTTSSAAGEEAEKSFLDYGYLRQGPLYQYLLTNWAAEHYPDYTVLPFEFVMKSTTVLKEPACVYEITDDIVQLGLYGGTVNGRPFKGCATLLDEMERQAKTEQYYLSYDKFSLCVESKPFKLNLKVVPHENNFELPYESWNILTNFANPMSLDLPQW